ncbi:MAG: hypothetical protein AAF183_12925 [Pseudomonadota bacterium]
MPDRFEKIDGAFATVIIKPGIYREADLYRRGDRAFVGYGRGFVAINPQGHTSHPSVQCDPKDIDMSEADVELVPAGHRFEVKPKAGRSPAKLRGVDGGRRNR